MLSNTTETVNKTACLLQPIGEWEREGYVYLAKEAFIDMYFRPGGKQRPAM